MTLRYAEMDKIMNGSDDFVARNRHPTIFMVFTLLVLVLFIALGLVIFGDHKQTLIALFIGVTCLVGWYIIMQIQRNNDLLLATEFQNALFASALGLNNKFCIIIRNDGNIVYLDRSFQKIFPNLLKQSTRTLDALLEQGHVPQDEIDKIYSAIERGVYEKVIFNIKDAEQAYTKLVMSIEPILRPNGFVMLRGREFVERTPSADAEPTATLLNDSTITLFSHVMDTMNMGVYMTDPTGAIIYANPVFERWLGYDNGEIVSRNLAISDIIHHNHGDTTRIEPKDYEGEIMLQKKSGDVMKTFMNQKIMRDERNNPMGCTAIIHNFSTSGPDMVKNLG